MSRKKRKVIPPIHYSLLVRQFVAYYGDGLKSSNIIKIMVTPHEEKADAIILSRNFLEGELGKSDIMTFYHKDFAATWLTEYENTIVGTVMKHKFGTKGTKEIVCKSARNALDYIIQPHFFGGVWHTEREFAVNLGEWFRKDRTLDFLPMSLVIHSEEMAKADEELRMVMRTMEENTWAEWS